MYMCYYIIAMSRKEMSQNNIDLRRYKSRGGIDLRGASIGLWLAENRARLAKIFIIILIILSAGFFIFSTYNYIIYFMTDDPNISFDAGVLSPRSMTTELELGKLEVISNSDKYDLAINIKNNNEKFLASFNYCWRLLDADLFCGNSFIFPQDEKYIIKIGQTGALSAHDISFNITDVFWQRVDNKKIPSWGVFEANRINLLVSEKTFLNSEQSGLSNILNLNTFSFNIKNQSAYSYYDLPLNILFFNADNNLVAVHRYSLSNFLSGEKREISFSLAGRFGAVQRIEVMPDVDIMDEGVYLKYSGEPTK